MLFPKNPFTPMNAPGNGRWGKITWKRHLLIGVVLVMILPSGSFFFLWAHAAGGSGETSNLANRYLNAAQEVLPGRLYRADSSTPDEIFAHGFTAQGHNYDLLSFLMRRSYGERYLPVYETLQGAEALAQDQVPDAIDALRARSACTTAEEVFYALAPAIGQFLLAECAKDIARRAVTIRTYAYEIDPAYAQNAFNVDNAIMRNRSMLRHYAVDPLFPQWAYVTRIPREAIIGAHVYESVDDGTGQRSFTDLHQFLPNPNYGGTTGQNPHYNPDDDPDSGWNDNTDPNLPTPSCPADPTVYQHCG